MSAIFGRGRHAAMSADEFLEWTLEQPADLRYELVGGVPVARAPEQIRHADVKGRIFRRLAEAIEAGGLPCQALVDGAGVRVSERQVFIPDVLVRCGEANADEAREISNPLLLVEVSSPSTAQIDNDDKLNGYFSIASVRHYLIVHPATRHVVHHRRDFDGGIRTALCGEEPIRLDPPGILLAGVFPQV